MRYPPPKGLSFTRCAIALAHGLGTPALALEFARANYPHDPAVVESLKAATAAGTTSGWEWATALGTYGVSSDFIEAVRGRTVIDRLANTRRVPFRTDVPRETTAATAGWIGETSPRPVSTLAFDMVRVEQYVATAIVAVTNEIIRGFRPGSEEGLHALLVAAVAAHLDEQFLDPEVAAVANVNPASITNAATRVTPTGTGATHLAADLAEVVESVTTPLSAPVWITSPRTCAYIAGMGGFEGVKINGGTLYGIPIITSTSARPVGSPGANLVVLLDAPELLVADDGVADVEASGETTLAMDTAPTSPANQSSMFQTDATAIRVRRQIAWKMAHDSGCAFTEVAY